MADPRYRKGAWKGNAYKHPRPANSNQQHPIRFGWGPSPEKENDRRWYLLPGTTARIRATAPADNLEPGWIVEIGPERWHMAGDMGEITVQVRVMSAARTGEAAQ